MMPTTLFANFSLFWFSLWGYESACTERAGEHLFQVVDLLDVAALSRLQLADVPVLISALLEECGGANLVAANTKATEDRMSQYQ